MPLSEEERAEAQRVAARLREELGSILGTLPPSARTAAGFARYLGVKRFSCQELLSALESGQPGPGMLTRVPGLAALTAIIAAMRTVGMDEAVVTGFESSVSHFRDFLERAGGNQRTLAKRLHADEDQVDGNWSGTSSFAPAPSFESDVEPEQQLFAAAKKLIGCWGLVQNSTQILAPNETNPEIVDLLWAFGISGHTVRWGSPPLVFRHNTGGETSPIEHETSSHEQVLLTEFCSTPTPRLTLSPVDGQDVFVLDHPPEKPVDIMTYKYTNMLSPLSRNHVSHMLELWIALNRPVEALLMDVFLHESLAKVSQTDLDVHLVHVLQGVQRGGRWSTRMPNKPAMKVLGMGLGETSSNLYPRQRELLTRLFEKKNLNPDEFVGYRCEIRYPLWRMGYRFVLDASRSFGASDGADRMNERDE